jgi:hypothetical protein
LRAYGGLVVHSDQNIRALRRTFDSVATSCGNLQAGVTNNINRCVLEAIDPATASIAHDLSFEIRDLAEIFSLLEMTAAEFDLYLCYPLDTFTVSKLKNHYGLNFDDTGFEVWLRPWHPNDDLPYKVHTGRELALMLGGVKPLAAFIDDHPNTNSESTIPEKEFESHVRAGSILRFVEPFARPCARSTTAAQRRDSGPPPGSRSRPPFDPLRLPVAENARHANEWRIDAYLQLWETMTKTGWTEQLEREQGTLLGYEDWQNDINIVRHREKMRTRKW